ncbi:MAG: hypothetical protein NTY96_11415 [Bacteroidetes bacterium]|nr:hypothetical protein [Bacteroidota bacterium]
MKKHDRKLRQEEMAYHIQSWKESGVSQQQYCSSNNLRFHTFYYWLKKNRSKNSPLTDGFIPIQVQSESSDTATNVEIQYPNGVRIFVPSMDIQFIGRLVRLV